MSTIPITAKRFALRISKNRSWVVTPLKLACRKNPRAVLHHAAGKDEIDSLVTALLCSDVGEHWLDFFLLLRKMLCNTFTTTANTKEPVLQTACSEEEHDQPRLRFRRAAKDKRLEPLSRNLDLTMTSRR